MINTKDKTMPSVDEKEMEEDDNEEEEANDEEEDATSSGDDVEEEDEEGAGEKDAEPSSQVAKESTPLSAEETQKPSDVLNLNNEVVKMRKEVKRVKALIIRKLTRQIAALKKKKGNEAETERNQRRAARLLEEVHSMKKLRPDLVTKTALQKNLNFDQVCKDPKSTICDRAVARITTHPQFRKKIESIKAAVEAFKEEHMKGGKRGGDPKGQRQPEKATRLSPDTRQDRKRQGKERDSAVNTQVQDDEEQAAAVPKGGKKSGKEEKVARPQATPDVHQRGKLDSTRDEAALVQSSGANSSTTPEPQSKVEEKSPSLQSAPELVPKSDEEESDVESSDDEEKEYFDDSTEERFHKQSSQSEESDEDDFFIGKVSKFKKKKKPTSGEGEEKLDNEQEGKKDSGNVKTDKLQSELDELESRLKSKALTAQSLFCASLAGSKGGRGGDKGKGGGKSGRGFSKLDRFTKQDNRTSHSGSRFTKPLPEGRRPGSDRTERGSAGGGRGKDVRKQKDRRGGGFSSHPPPQPALHPSWEASKKRKEQQGQILAFQGKKIKFDDDD
ncbi:serum response factor-binding protein 1 [Fundulus diaphanus]